MNWGVVFYFLFIPAVVMIYITFELPKVDNERIAFVAHFHYGITALVAAMMGLNSWDKKSNGNKP